MPPGQTIVMATPLTHGERRFATAQWVWMLGVTAGFVWFAPGWGPIRQLTGVTALAVTFWVQGALVRRWLNAWACLMVQAAVLSTVSAAWGWAAVHQIAKPAAMVFALFYIAKKSYKIYENGLFYSQKRWLLAAAAWSLVGDVLLMLSPGLFVGGLAAFLLAHLCYLALFSRDTPWFASRMAVVGTLAVGGLMYAVLLTGLPPALRLPVAAYVLAIAAMAAQAMGRAATLGTVSARRVAWGAVAFMCSDALLGINRFVHPLPLSAVWVLGTYYAAQALIVFNVLPSAPPPKPPATPCATDTPA